MKIGYHNVWLAILWILCRRETTWVLCSVKPCTINSGSNLVTPEEKNFTSVIIFWPNLTNMDIPKLHQKGFVNLYKILWDSNWTVRQWCPHDWCPHDWGPHDPHDWGPHHEGGPGLIYIQETRDKRQETKCKINKKLHSLEISGFLCNKLTNTPNINKQTIGKN